MTRAARMFAPVRDRIVRARIVGGRTVRAGTVPAVQNHTPGEADPPLDVLLVRAGRAVERRRRASIAAHGLSGTGLSVLQALVGADRTSQRELAAAVGLAPATLTPVLDDLEHAGLVVRERAVDDRRAVGIAISSRGRDRAARATAAVATEMADRLPPARDPDDVRRYLTDVLAAVSG